MSPAASPRDPDPTSGGAGASGSPDGGTWLTRGVLSVGAASFGSDACHEMTTSLLPAFLTSTLHAGPAALGAIDGVSDALIGLSKLAGGPLAADPRRRARIASGGYLTTAVATALIGLAATVWQVGVLRAVAWAARGLRSPARDPVDTAFSYGFAHGTTWEPPLHGTVERLRSHAARRRRIHRRLPESLGPLIDRQVAVALDPAASEFHRGGAYHVTDQALSTAEMVECYDELVDRYPIWSIEDGLAENDWDGWAALTERLGSRVQLVGDDIFVTNPAIIEDAIGRGVANAALIKVNQIGSVSETLHAMAVCRRAGTPRWSPTARARPRTPS